MNILVSNDDGISRRGIHELVYALAALKDAHIYVFAPDRERTAAGHGITMREQLYLEPWDKADYNDLVEEAYSCSGTPADCVKIGISTLRERGITIDLVCSGINHGSNLGTDVYYSGTIACAIEGRLMGVPAIGFSLCSHECTQFEVFKKLVPEIVTKTYGRVPEDTILNVNVPDISYKELKGIAVTGMGPRDYTDVYKPMNKTEKGTYYKYIGEDVFFPDAPADWDVTSSQMGYVTIAPISIKMTRQSTIEEIKNWGISL